MKNHLKIKSTAVFFVVFLINISGMAQMSFGGLPVSFTKVYLSEDVPVVELPAVQLKQETMKSIPSKDKPYYIGTVQDVDFTMDNIGRTDIMADGSKVWRVCFKSQDAYFTNVSFQDFQIPENAELYIYTPDKKFMIGKFTTESVLDNHIFYTQAVPGAEVVLEYYEPAEVAFAGYFKITGIQYGFVDVFKNTKGNFGQSSACQIDVKCPEGSLFANQINAVVHYHITIGGDTYMCSGALINNTRNDRTPYILSANHCADGGTVTQFVTYFNYEASECGGSSGVSNHTAIGMNIIASGDKKTSSDFLLMKITGQVNSNYNLYFAGWDRRVVTPTIGACIHHPQGDFKKISLPSSVSLGETLFGYANFWKVKWRQGSANKGVTEEGSSGSPLFNSQRLIVGTLCCGSSDCDSPASDDYYGKFFYSWNNGNTANTSRKLSPWLDPDATGVTTCDGLVLGVQEYQTSVYETLTFYPNPVKETMKIQGIDAFGEGCCRIYSVLGQIVYQKNLSLSSDMVVNMPTLKSGIYYMEITTSDKKYGAKFLVEN